MINRLLLLPLIFFSTLAVFGQESEHSTRPSNKGRFYAFWGWNRGYYTNSDVHFKGDDYDFTLKNIVATDRPTPFALDPYFHPSWITIPQTNLRVGFFINDKYDISIGDDHMKYVMVQDRAAQITGRIDTGAYSGTYNGEEILLTEDFLTFEHTDGLNYVNIEITRNDDILEVLKVNHNYKKVQLNTLLGAGVGLLYPKSNVLLMNGERYDAFHVAGYGLAIKTGLNLTLFKYLFFRSELKYGFINMPDIRSTPSTRDKASQHFFFSQVNFNVGFTLYPFKQSE